MHRKQLNAQAHTRTSHDPIPEHSCCFIHRFKLADASQVLHVHHDDMVLWACAAVSKVMGQTGVNITQNVPTSQAPPDAHPLVLRKAAPVLLTHVQIRVRPTRLCFLRMLACVCMRLKVWLAARVPLRLASCALLEQGAHEACVPRLQAEPVLFAHAFVRCNMEKTYSHGQYVIHAY